MDYNALCPECDGMICSEQRKGQASCPKCGASIAISRAIKLFEERFPTKGESIAPPSAGTPSPVTDFEITRDGTMKRYKGAGGAVVLPRAVKRIADQAFYGSESPTSIYIPQGVTAIGGSAFLFCDKLTSVFISKTVKHIDNYIFSVCDSLESITVEKGNRAYFSAGNCIIESATKTLIAGCNVSIIPSDGSVLHIGEGAFSTRKTLVAADIPKGVRTVGEYAFSACSGLEDLVISEGVTEIGRYAFRVCESLTSLVIPEGVTDIGDGAFYWCKSLSSVSLPQSLKRIGESAFEHCESLRSITVPKGAKFSPNTFDKHTEIIRE